MSLEISQVEQDLKSFILADLEDSKIRSRVLLLEEGETATLFFFGLERKRPSQNLVSSIYDANGVEVFSREEIERAHVVFYTKLFSEEPIDECYKQMCFDNIRSTLPPDQRDSCEGELTLSELSTSSVNSLSLNRSPDLDRLTVEFYRHFWHLLGPLLLRVACECFRQGFLTNSMKGSITRLIFKKRGDKKYLKNWRPISLLNVDYIQGYYISFIGRSSAYCSSRPNLLCSR